MGERGDEPGLVAGEPWGEWRNEGGIKKPDSNKAVESGFGGG
jgi:hypothetical protein